MAKLAKSTQPLRHTQTFKISPGFTFLARWYRLVRQIDSD
jgi:hypothetical protein